MARRALYLNEVNKLTLDFMLEHPRCAIFADCGMGKTLSGLVLDDILRLTGKCSRPSLVLGPRQVCEDTWPNEAAKWDMTADTRVSAIVGDKDQRLAAMWRPAEVYTCNYEQLPWLVDYYAENWPYGQVFADESPRLKGHRLKGQGGLRTNWIARVAHSLTDRWVNMTATPSPNGLKDLWGQMWFLDRGQRLGLTHTAFMDRWFRKKFSGHGVEPMPFAQEQIQAAIADICLTLDPHDFYDIQEPRVNPIRVTLPPRVLAAYKRLEDKMFTELESGTPIEVFNAGSLTNKCRQFANGAVYTTWPAWEAVHNVKIEALESIAIQSTMPLLVAYDFKSDLARLLKAFPKGVDLKKSAGKAAFAAGDAPFGFMQPGSSLGIDGLQYVTSTMVRFGHTWNWEDKYQMLQRIGPMRQIQAGFDRVVTVHDIIADDTLDDLVIAATDAKQSVEDALKQACKKRRK